MLFNMRLIGLLKFVFGKLGYPIRRVIIAKIYINKTPIYLTSDKYKFYKNFIDRLNIYYKREVLPDDDRTIASNGAAFPFFNKLKHDELHLYSLKKPKMGRLNINDGGLEYIDDLLKNNDECFVCEPGWPEEIKIDKKGEYFYRSKGRRHDFKPYTKEMKKENYVRSSAMACVFERGNKIDKYPSKNTMAMFDTLKVRELGLKHYLSVRRVRPLEYIEKDEETILH